MIFFILYGAGALLFCHIIQREIEDAFYWSTTSKRQRIKMIVLGALLSATWVFSFPLLLIKEWFDDDDDDDDRTN